MSPEEIKSKIEGIGRKLDKVDNTFYEIKSLLENLRDEILNLKYAIEDLSRK